MKKRICEILLCVGILLSVFAFMISLFLEKITCCGATNLLFLNSLFIIFRILSLVGIFLIIMALVNWSSKKKRGKK